MIIVGRAREPLRNSQDVKTDPVVCEDLVEGEFSSITRLKLEFSRQEATTLRQVHTMTDLSDSSRLE
jgi:hypothetical protein